MRVNHPKRSGIIRYELSMRQVAKILSHACLLPHFPPHFSLTFPGPPSGTSLGQGVPYATMDEDNSQRYGRTEMRLGSKKNEVSSKVSLPQNHSNGYGDFEKSTKLQSQLRRAKRRDS